MSSREYKLYSTIDFARSYLELGVPISCLFVRKTTIDNSPEGAIVMGVGTRRKGSNQNIIYRIQIDACARSQPNTFASWFLGIEPSSPAPFNRGEIVMSGLLLPDRRLGNKVPYSIVTRHERCLTPDGWL